MENTYDMFNLTITTYSTYASVHILKNQPFSSFVREFLIRKLTDYIYEPKFNKYKQDKQYFYYDYDNNTLTIPINFVKELKGVLTNRGVDVRIKKGKLIISEVIDIQQQPSWLDRPDQVEAIQFLSSLYQMKGLAAQTGCLTGDSIIKFNRNNVNFKLTLKEAYYKFNGISNGNNCPWGSHITYVRSFTGTTIELHPIEAIVYSGEKEVYLLTLENGNTIRGTYDHEIQTKEGMIELGTIVGRYVLCDELIYSRAISIEYVGIEDTYDIQCYGPYHNFVANDIVVHNSGKTYMAIKSIVNLNRTALIITAGLVEQWIKSIKQQLIIEDEDLYILQGYKSISNLIESDIRPKIMVGSLATIRNYINKTGNYEYEEITYSKFLEKYNIGVKIVDECHENFHSIVQMDLRSKVRHNIYLSATYSRNNKSTKTIFDKVFPPKMRYGEHEYKRYVNITFYSYSIKINENRVVKARGYQHIKYEQVLLKISYMFQTFLESVIYPLIDSHYINKRLPKQKLLIIVNTVDMVQALVDKLSSRYPHEIILPFTAEDPSENLHGEVDIIVSTFKSCGTGTDIANLRTVINTVSTQADTLVKQILGRLRELHDSTPEMVDITNNCIKSHKRHYKVRKDIYKQLGLQYKEFVIY